MDEMDQSDKSDILQFLRSGRKALFDALSGVDETAARRIPATGGWSILGCVEHVAISEAYLLTRLQQAQAAAQSLENRARETRFLERATNRSRRIDAPPLSHPTGRYATVQEAFAAFDSARTQVVRFVENFDDDLRSWSTDHPMIQGPVNCFEILLMIAAHPGRHARQIVEIRQALQSPTH